jgi:hypothetical protein
MFSTLSSGDDALARSTMDVVDQLRSDFGARDELYRQIDDVIFQQKTPQIPQAYQRTTIEVLSPRALEIVNTVTAALSINPFTVQFRPIGFGDVYQQNASKREHFFEASWQRQEDEANRRLLRLFIANLVAKGEGILKTMERTKRAWAGYDQQSKRLQAALDDGADDYRGLDQDARDRVYHSKTEQLKLLAPYPITTTDVPPETFYYFQNEDGLTTACEVKEVPYLEALDRFGASLDSKGKVTDPRALGLPRNEWARVMGNLRTLTMVECWTWDRCVYLLQGPGQSSSQAGRIGRATVVKSLRHGYGDPALKTLRGPYFHALGTTTASRLPERAGLSILYGYLSLFPLLDSLLTGKANAAYLTMFPTFKRNQPPGVIPGLPGGVGPYGNDGSEGDYQTETIEPGTIYPYDISPLEQPRAGPEAIELLGRVEAMLERALPSVVQGVVSGDESGYALNQAAHLARLAWDPIVGNAEVTLGERTGFESWLIEHKIGETVYAWGEQIPTRRRRGGGLATRAGWFGLGPEDLSGVHRYRARLDPETPSNKVMETRAIGEQMDRRLITYEDAVEQAGSNPDEVERSWLLHDLKMSQPVQAELQNTVFEKLATIRSKRNQRQGLGGLEVQQTMPGGTPPPPGGPPAAGPDVYAPGMGMPLLPTPPGAVTGIPPSVQAALPPAPPGPGGGGAPGTPVQPNLPARHQPLPGQG